MTKLMDDKINDASLPIYLHSPPELSGFKLFKFKLRRHFRGHLSLRYLTLFDNNSKHFMKRGHFVRLQEALTMEYIARNTTIPIPRLLDVFTVKGKLYIVQERIRGPILEDVWHRLSPEEQHSCIMQTKAYLDQLRALEPPHPERVQAIDGSGIMDTRLSSDNVWGPFDNHHEFHRFLNHDNFRGHPERFPEVQESLAKVAGKKYRTVFSHGDFGPHNMILRNGTVFVIDWEMAGWTPEYWDYIRAYAARGHFTAWWNMFQKVVDRYDEELEVQNKIGFYTD